MIHLFATFEQLSKTGGQLVARISTKTRRMEMIRTRKKRKQKKKKKKEREIFAFNGTWLRDLSPLDPVQFI